MKLHILRGLPASGKTTFAKELVRKSGNTVRLNRDDLRAMCFEGKWSGPREKLIIDMERQMASVALLRRNQNVVIDDTNLGKDIWQELSQHPDVERVNHDFTDVPISTCIERDRVREKAVGPGVIHRLAASGGLIPFTGKPIVICDLDGTLADLSHRLHFIQQDPKDYESFFLAQADDPPIRDIVEHVQALSVDHDIVIVSGRPDTYSYLTVRWLETFEVPYVSLLMRRGGDHRPDDMVKEEILALLPKEKVVKVIDDRPRVIRMWLSNGLNVMAVNQEAWVGKED